MIAVRGERALNQGAPREHPSWATNAQVHTHPMAAWWGTIHGKRRRGRGRFRVVGNVVHLPAPVAGYRLRHDGGAVIVEIKPSRAPAIFLGRFENESVARAFLAQVSADHQRPFLGEFGRAAA
jgi:hypothetical protein